MSDIRLSLLRRDALSAAKEVLYHLDISLGSSLQGPPSSGPPSGPPPATVDKSTVDLVEEFIYHAPKDRNAQPKRLSCLQELQLLEIMCSYFQDQSRDAVRHLIFSALFGLQGNQVDDARMAMLAKLVSMAIAVGRVPILDCTATWLQRSHAVCCVRVARVLVDDYCRVVPGSAHTLKQVFNASPAFCCQFVTAVTALYDLSSEDLTPPPALLEMVVDWITDDPRLLLLTFLNTPLPAASLSRGCLELTPLLGLLRWSVKAPLANQRNRKQALANGHAELEKGAGLGAEADELYSKLHLSVLQVFLMLQVHLSEKNLIGQLSVLQWEQVVGLVDEVGRLGEELNPLHAANYTQLALDRLAQALQVAMATGALLCAREELRPLCSRLPHNNLMQLVMSGPFQPPLYPHLPLAPHTHAHTHTHTSPLSPHIHTALSPHTHTHAHTHAHAHAALSPHNTHPALQTAHNTHTHAVISPHTFHPAMGFPYRPIR
ncbi:integrator complex subunit 15 [Sardina pilchardus]|uniref:integrator complex subunit 15 n=1 Tax=Sardina pilchardus TaxID=27697 RepID=UPI002E0EF34D